MEYDLSVYLISDIDGVPAPCYHEDTSIVLPGNENFLTEITHALRAKSFLNGREYHECLAGRRTWQKRESQIAGYNCYALQGENESEIQILIRPAVVPCQA